MMSLGIVSTSDPSPQFSGEHALPGKWYYRCARALERTGFAPLGCNGGHTGGVHVTGSYGHAMEATSKHVATSNIN